MSIKDKYEVRAIQKEETYPWLLKKHYAHRKPSISYAFGLYYGDMLSGVITFGKPASYTLCECLLGKDKKDLVFELNRLVVNDGLHKNTLSYFVSSALKKMPKPIAIVSYADHNQGHHGYIYQATNWLYTGLSSMERIYHMDTGEVIYTRRHIEKKGVVIKTEKQLPKFRYVYLIGNKKQIKIMKNLLRYKIKSYPKGDNKRYDASYSPDVQGLLF